MTTVIPTGPRRPRRPALFPGLAILPLAILLSACGLDNPDAFAPSCPVVEVPGAAADLVSYDGDTRDIGHLIARAGVTRVTGSCRNAGGRTNAVVTDISLGMTVTRGPTAGRTVKIPYFIAVVYDGTIRNKKQFVETVEFPSNVTQMLTHAPVVPITLPLSRHVTIDGYHIEVGFQLTHDQLEYNRTHLVAPSFHPM
ncbi:hypothetical protein [Gluconacetobacter diazotrophicus]|nr:hypothetical protein [Gluconacetobacter diazotrophicus]